MLTEEEFVDLMIDLEETFRESGSLEMLRYDLRVIYRVHLRDVMEKKKEEEES